MIHYPRVLVWNAAAIAAAGTLTSPVIDLAGSDRAEAVLVKFSSVAGAADCKLEYAISDDSVIFGGFSDSAAIIASSNTLFTANKEGLHTVSMPALLARYIQLQVTELTGALADTLVTVTLLLREVLP